MDNPHANLPARLPAASSRLPAQAPVASRELVPATPPSAVNSRLLLRGLMRNWWRILVIWLVLAAPLTYVVYRVVEPTYQAYAMINVESNRPELFDRGLVASDGSQPSYLQTEIEYLRSNPVLALALSKPTIEKLAMIKNSLDPKADLRSKLQIQVISGTHWIRVAMESRDPKEAADIINAVVDSYQLLVEDPAIAGKDQKFKKDFNKSLKKGLEEYEKKLSQTIEQERAEIRELASRGNVQFSKKSKAEKGEDDEQELQSVFNQESLELYKSTKDRLMQTEFEIMELEARYAAKQAEQQQQLQTAGESTGVASNSYLIERIGHEFKRDPEVVSVIDLIRATTEAIEHTKGVVRRGADPARIAAQRRLASLKENYNNLWKTKSEEIRQRLLVPTSASGDART